jgi:hypothetical protein
MMCKEVNYEKYISKKSYEIGLKINKNVTINDIISDAYIHSFDNNKNMFHSIVDVIYNYYYTKNGQKQLGRKVSKDYEKKCKKCCEVKNQAEFRHQFSKKFNLFYLDSYCKICRNEYTNERRNFLYKNNAEYREKILIKERERSKKNKDYNRWRYNNDLEYRERIKAKNKRYENNKSVRKNSIESTHS